MKQLGFIVLLVILLAFPPAARADIAPPIFPPGSNPQPGAELTQVRMAAETVVIEVLKDTVRESLGRAHVMADFTMHNIGIVDESMAVRFPISANDGWGRFPEIENVRIMVNGKQVPHRRASYPDIRFMSEDVPWAEFDVTFPAGKDVTIRVAYDLKGTGYYPISSFYYIFFTGRGWKDTIGSADVILHLPYEASPQNVLLDMETGWGGTTPGGVLQGNEIRWHFEDFEPGENDGIQTIEFSLVAPSAWQAVLTARANVERNPDDGEAWGVLGKAYKEAYQISKGYREDAGGQELYNMAVKAYEQCLSLKPDDAQWHAGFADLLAGNAMWDSWRNPKPPETYRALEEIRTALELAPNDPVVREIAENMAYMIDDWMAQNGDDYDMLWLTQTPTAPPPPTPTMVPVDDRTATPQPTPAPTETSRVNSPQATATEPNPTPVPQGSSQLCGSATFLPLIGISWFVWKRKYKIAQ